MVMPSEDYNRLTDVDLAALVAYLQALPAAQPVAEGVTRQHGACVAHMCLGCHGPQLAGGKIPGGPPDWPAAPDLTST